LGIVYRIPNTGEDFVAEYTEYVLWNAVGIAKVITMATISMVRGQEFLGLVEAPAEVAHMAHVGGSRRNSPAEGSQGVGEDLLGPGVQAILSVFYSAEAAPLLVFGFLSCGRLAGGVGATGVIDDTTPTLERINSGIDSA
jgi:hypothetical protein